MPESFSAPLSLEALGIANISSLHISHFTLFLLFVGYGGVAADTQDPFLALWLGGHISV